MRDYRERASDLMNPNQGPPNHTPELSHWEIALFVINAQLNLTWSPQIPCKVTDYSAQLVHIGCAEAASRVTLLRYIPFLNDSIYEICFIPLGL